MQCILCGSSKTDNIYSSDKGCVWGCKSCRGCFNTTVADADVNKIYDDNYYQSKYADIHHKQMLRSKGFINLLKDYVSGGSILDYGCGTGVFLKAAQEGGFYNNLGVDVSEAALNIAQENVGQNVTFINTAKEIPEKKYEVVSFVDSIAHIPDVRTTFESLLHRNLSESGVIFIKTPNVSASYVWYATVLSKIIPKKYGNYLFYLPQRYILFNEKSINKFLDSLKLEILYLTFIKDYSSSVPITSFKGFFGHLLVKTVPRILNPYDSMVIIARVKL